MCWPQTGRERPPQGLPALGTLGRRQEREETGADAARQTSNMRVWTFTELLSSRALFVEGQVRGRELAGGTGRCLPLLRPISATHCTRRPVLPSCFFHARRPSLHFFHFFHACPLSS